MRFRMLVVRERISNSAHMTPAATQPGQSACLCRDFVSKSKHCVNRLGRWYSPTGGAGWKIVRTFLLLLAVVAPAVSSLHAEAKVGGATKVRFSSELAAKVDAAVRAEMTRQALVGASVGVLRKGEIVYLQGYGFADREKQVPVTVDTAFNWASNSKPLCGMLAMQLVEKGLLDLDADVRRYVPEFPEQTAGVITMRHLLAHQSGIGHYDVIPAPKELIVAKPPFDPVRFLDKFSGTPLVFKPGEKRLYSSYAYILASAVVQRAGKEPYVEQLQKRIAGPLGLASLQLDTEYNGQPHWSAGYTKNEAGEVVRAPENAHWWKFGAGGYKSNVRDFALWAQAVLNHRLIAPETEAAMWTPQKTSDGEPTERGLGFIIDGDGDLSVSHGGKQTETTTRLVIYPQKRHGIVVMTNCGFGDTSALTTAIYQALSPRAEAGSK